MTNRLERLADLNESLLAAMDASKGTIWTALPGIIQSFDAAKMTCVVKPAIKGSKVVNGAREFVSMPLLLDCPVIFPNGGGFSLTFPIASGDECLVLFSSRCIDSWWALGGEQNPFEHRMLDLSDGFVLPGPRSKPRAIPAISTTNVQLRNEDGSAYVDIDPDGAISLVSPLQVSITAPDVAITGNVAIGGGSLTHNGHDVGSTHKHTGVTAGGALTGNPQ